MNLDPCARGAMRERLADLTVSRAAVEVPLTPTHSVLVGLAFRYRLLIVIWRDDSGSVGRWDGVEKKNMSSVHKRVLLPAGFGPLSFLFVNVRRSRQFVRLVYVRVHRTPPHTH